MKNSSKNKTKLTLARTATEISILLDQTNKRLLNQMIDEFNDFIPIKCEKCKKIVMYEKGLRRFNTSSYANKFVSPSPPPQQQELLCARCYTIEKIKQ